jgi:hypothetical protein
MFRKRLPRYILTKALIRSWKLKKMFKSHRLNRLSRVKIKKSWRQRRITLPQNLSRSLLRSKALIKSLKMRRINPLKNLLLRKPLRKFSSRKVSIKGLKQRALIKSLIQRALVKNRKQQQKSILKLVKSLWTI